MVMRRYVSCGFNENFLINWLSNQSNLCVFNFSYYISDFFFIVIFKYHSVVYVFLYFIFLILVNSEKLATNLKTQFFNYLLNFI